MSGRHVKSGEIKTIRKSENGHQTRLAQEWDEIPQSKSVLISVTGTKDWRTIGANNKTLMAYCLVTVTIMSQTLCLNKRNSRHRPG